MMKKSIRLAVLFDQHIQSGGGYQQQLNAAMHVQKLSSELVLPFYFTTIEKNIDILKDLGIDAIFLKLDFFRRVWDRLNPWIGKFLSNKINDALGHTTAFEHAFTKNEIDLIYFLSPNANAKKLRRLNYIVTVWDLCHRDDLEFPEVRWDGEFEAREFIYWSILPRSVAILVDSDLGKINIEKRYGIDRDRIFVMPFEASGPTRKNVFTLSEYAIDIAFKYKLIHPYIFYPAQFWAHKNHVYLLDGVVLLEKLHGIKVCVIFCGSDKGNKLHIQKVVNDLGLYERVRFAGFVSDHELICLYKQSIALVMPTYFGPTNLPPLEAFELGVPVLYSDKPGLKDQVEGAALLMDLNNPSSLADHLKCLMMDQAINQKLIYSGYRKIEELNKFNHVSILKSIMENFLIRRRNWS